MGAISLIRDWIVLNGETSADEITQSREDQLNTLPYTDAVFFLQVKESNVTMTIDYQTAPLDDEPFWQTMRSVTFKGATSIMSIIRFSAATTPLSALVRYKVSSASNDWNVSFRIASMFKNE